MPAFDVLLAFALTTAVFAFVPGPAMLYAAARTMAGGRRAGLMAVLGIHLGAYVHIVAAAAGLAMLFHAVPIAYTVVKLGGAFYLVWLGISLFRSKSASDHNSGGQSSKSARRAFIESVSVEVLNPKTVLFFVAFLPQFIDASATLPVWVQFVILGAVVNAIFTLADLAGVMLAQLMLAKLKRSKAIQKLAQRAGGTILVGLGAHLAFQRN